MATEFENLKKEVEVLKKELRDLKAGLRTEIISQQNNSRDPFRSDRGEVVLKKNANIKSRKSLIPEYDNILSVFFNESANNKVNAIYLGHNGGDGGFNTGEISTVVRHNSDLPTTGQSIYTNGSYSVAIVDSERPSEEEFLNNRIIQSFKTKYLTGDTTDSSNSSFLTGGRDGFVGLGFWENNVLSSGIYTRDGNIYLSPESGKNLKVGPSETNGFSGTVSNPTSITVENGIVTDVS